MPPPRHRALASSPPPPRPQLEPLRVLCLRRVQQDLLRWFIVIRLLVMGVHTGTSFLFLLLGVRGQFLALVQSAVFVYLAYLFAILYSAWNFLPRMLRREFDDVAQFLHKPSALEAYRAVSIGTATNLSRIYYTLCILVFGFFLTITFVGPPIIPWMTTDFAPRLYRMVTLPMEALMVVLVWWTLPVSTDSYPVNLAYKPLRLIEVVVGRRRVSRTTRV